MKLLVVNWQDRRNPQAGGAEVHVHKVFGLLAAAGHDVSLLASGWRGAARRERIDGIDVHRVGSRYTFGIHASAYYRRELLRERFDVVIEALNKVPVFTPRWAERPCVLLVHHLFGSTAFREAAAPLAAATWLLERPLARVYRGVPVQAISHSTAADLVQRGLAREQIAVIPPGVEVEPLEGAGGRAPVPTFLYLGRLKRYKRVDLILHAMARLNGRGQPVRLVIGGRGDWEPHLRRLAEQLRIAPQVRFAGFVPEDGKRELFRSAWANVFVSPKEGWGITNMEAAACATPTVASDSPGLRESVLHGETGLLVPHGDVGALADALAGLAADPTRVETLGEGALRFARQFSWTRAAECTEQHLRAVLGRTERPAALPTAQPVP